MNKTVAVVGIVGILVVIGFFIAGGNTSTTSQTNTKLEPQATQTQTERTALYPISEVELHSTKNDCWLAIKGNVYDVTSYVQSGFHPGKDAILNGCGKDATQLFSEHSDKAQKMLIKFEIGKLQ